MADVREEILARIRTVIETVPGLAADADGTVRGVGRNRDDVSGKGRPAIILHDGSEQRLDVAAGPRRSGVQMMKMDPELTILLGTSTDQLGTAASALRAALLKAIFADAQLITLTGGAVGVGGGSDLVYEGSEFESQAGETREGRMVLHLSFTYPLRLSDL